LTAAIAPGFIAASYGDGTATGHHLVNALDITNDGNANSLLNGSFFGFCIEPNQFASSDISAGDGTYAAAFAAVTPMVQRLFDLGFDSADNSATSAVAFNLALQELMLETTSALSLDDGSFKRAGFDAFAQTAAASANALLQQVMGTTGATHHFDVVSFRSASSQDFMSAIPTPATNVPEPSGLALMGAALAAAAAVAHRRRRG
jgi:hypothetical protein